ncbi:MAG: InlB B-repeat-containing protein, partial [Alphaproteobacteria bacterium]
MNKKLLFLLAAIFVLQTDGYAAVSCPSGYVAVNEDVVYISDTNSCPSGHTKLGGEYGGDTIENCITALANGSGICTFFDTSCQSGKYFDGTSFKTCLAGTYCDGNGTAVPGTSGCSVSCPGNSTSASGATACTCNTGYNYNGGTTTTTNACVPNIYSVTYDCNGGTGGTTVSAIYNRDLTVQTGVCTRDGYEFDGWTMDGNDISGTFKWTYTSNKTLVAQWNECAVCNAGTGATCDMTVVDNTCTYTTECMFGYDTLTGNGTNTPSCTATKYTITYDANGGKDVASKTYTIEDAF